MAETQTDFFPELPGYELLSELGRGGVSTVYLARHLLLERQVAIKVMAPALTVEEGFTKRFIREGQTVARLNHPGIVTVYDVAEVNHRPYIAMEYLPAGSLKDRMKNPVAPEEALMILRAVADSLGYAHDAGIYHRDVKPENILFRDNGQPVLTDFGIAKSDSQNTALTSVGVVVGTPRYISPEQAQGHDCDARSDIYALGIIFYEMLTGAPPFDVKGSMSLLYAHINEPIPRLPQDLEAYQCLVDDLMAKDPDERIADCRLLVQRIDGSEQAAAAPSVRPGSPRVGVRSSSLSASKRRPILAAGLLLPVVLLAAWYAVYSGLAGWNWGPDGRFETMVSRLVSDGESAADTSTTEGDEDEDEDKDEDGELDTPDVDPDEAFIRARELVAEGGAERDPVEAVRWYKLAAANGHAKAQYHLGVAYGNGHGVERNEKRAVEWLVRASQGGEKGAQYNLVLAQIFGPEPDARAASELARILADQRYAPVYQILGWMYNTGTGVDASLVQSVKWSAKTMIGDVTGSSSPPDQIVEHWQRQLQVELRKVWNQERHTVR